MAVARLAWACIIVRTALRGRIGARGITGLALLTWDIGTQWPARVGKTVKGMFVALALVVALEREPDPLATLLALIGAVLAFLVGELYDATVEAQIRNRRGLTAIELREIAYEQSFITAGAIPAVIIFTCASGGLLSASLADNVTVWTGIVLLGGLGTMTGVLSRSSVFRCVLFGLESAFIGALVVVLKALVKKI